MNIITIAIAMIFIHQQFCYSYHHHSFLFPLLASRNTDNNLSSPAEAQLKEAIKRVLQLSPPTPSSCLRHLYPYRFVSIMEYLSVCSYLVIKRAFYNVNSLQKRFILEQKRFRDLLDAFHLFFIDN